MTYTADQLRALPLSDLLALGSQWTVAEIETAAPDLLIYVRELERRLKAIVTSKRRHL